MEYSWGGKSKNPDVVAELMPLKTGQWIFVNFHFPNSHDPNSENLLSMLKRMLEPTPRGSK